MLLAASLTVLLRLPAPERPEKEEPAPADRLVGAAAQPPFSEGDADEYGVETFGHVHRRLCRGVPDSGAGTDVFEIMVWVTAGNPCRSLCTPLMARLAARIGWKNVTALTIAMMACVAALGGGHPAKCSIPVRCCPYWGGAHAGMDVGFLKTMQVATSPSATRGMYFSVNSLFNGASALLGSVLEAMRSSACWRPTRPTHCAASFVGLAGALAAAVMAHRAFPAGKREPQENEKFLGLFFGENPV